MYEVLGSITSTRKNYKTYLFTSVCGGSGGGGGGGVCVCLCVLSCHDYSHISIWT
jgi:hypothetical protein